MQNLDSDTMNAEEQIVSKLTEKEKRAVQKFHRKLSRNSILSIRSDDGLKSDDDEADDDEVTEEEALRLQRVIQAFQHHKKIQGLSSADNIDGRYKRLSSQSFDWLLSSTTKSDRYISPGRFHVSLSEESKAIVREVNQLIQNTLRRSESREILVVQNQELNSSYHALNHESHSNVNGDSALYLRPGDITVHFNHENYRGNGTNSKNRMDNYVGNGNAMHPEKHHANGHACGQNWYTVPLSLLPPKERFQFAVRRVIQSERRRKRKDYFEKLWKRRGNVSWFGLLLTLIGPCAFIADSATDLKVASDHFLSGDPWWGTFTLMLVFVPAILMNIVSYFFYKDDEDQANRKPESGWCTVKITHLFQFGLLERYWQIFVKSYRIKFKRTDNFQQYQLLIAMNLDTAMLQMILAFTEDAPQLVLQLYVLIRRKLVEDLIGTSLQDIWTMASICFSFISYSRALVNYISCLRDSKHDKGQLRWYGYIAMWFWRAFMFISRVLVLVFFATEFNVWFFLVLSVHFFIILALTWSHKVDFFSEQKALQLFIRVVISYIHTFCYFVLDGKQTVRWAKTYYILVALEAVLFSTLWYTHSSRYVSLKFELAVMFVIFVSFGLGILMMAIYYKFLHPKFKRPQTKWYGKTIPKEELVENVKNEEEDVNECSEEQFEDNVQQGRRTSMMQQVAVWV